MAPEILFTHSQSGRRPLTMVAGLFCAGMVGVGLWQNAPWFWWIPIGGACLGIGWMLIANPRSGAELTSRTLRFHRDSWERSVALADIARVERHIWSEGPDEITLILQNGEALPIPSQCINKGFVAALQMQGVAVLPDSKGNVGYVARRSSVPFL